MIRFSWLKDCVFVFCSRFVCSSSNKLTDFTLICENMVSRYGPVKQENICILPPPPTHYRMIPPQSKLLKFLGANQIWLLRLVLSYFLTFSVKCQARMALCMFNVERTCFLQIFQELAKMVCYKFFSNEHSFRR